VAEDPYESEPGKARHMAKGSSEYAAWLDGRRPPVNAGASFPSVEVAHHVQREHAPESVHDGRSGFRGKSS